LKNFLKEINAGKIQQNNFLRKKRKSKYMGIAIKSAKLCRATFTMLNVPKNTTVTIYNSGCLLRDGGFSGYEKEHYDISMQMGEDTLFQRRAR
jgi:hypothetical protein